MTQIARTSTTALDPQEVEDHAAAAAEGDREAFGWLYETHVDRVYRLALLRIGDPTDAQDVTSKVWLRVLHGIARYSRAGGGFPAWLMTITTRQIADHWRSLARRRERLAGDVLAIGHAAPGETPADVLKRTELAREVADLVERLPTAQRQVLHLRLWVGLSTLETAAVLGKSRGAVKMSVHRALTALRGMAPDTEIHRDRSVARAVTSLGEATAHLSDPS